MTLDIEQALFVKLSTTAAIMVICSTRVYPYALPPLATIPAIAYHLIDSPLEMTHDETAGQSLARHDFQFDAYSTTYAGAVALSAAIHTALHGFKGVITKGADTFTIQACLRTAKRDDHDSETNLYWRSLDFQIWAQE